MNVQPARDDGEQVSELEERNHLLQLLPSDDATRASERAV